MAGQERSGNGGEQLKLLPPARLLAITEVAELLGVPKSFIYRRTARGHDDPIPHYRIGSHLRFALDEVEGWIERHRNEPEQRPAAGLVAALREKSSPRSMRRLKEPQIRRRER